MVRIRKHCGNGELVEKHGQKNINGILYNDNGAGERVTGHTDTCSPPENVNLTHLALVNLSGIVKRHFNFSQYCPTAPNRALSNSSSLAMVFLSNTPLSRTLGLTSWYILTVGSEEFKTRQLPSH